MNTETDFVNHYWR